MTVLKSEFKSAFVSAAIRFDTQKRKGITIYENEFRRYWRTNGVDILRKLKIAGQEQQLRVTPKTEQLDLGFVFEQYRDWKGHIIRDAKNGEKDAYLCRISPDGIKFYFVIVNKQDVELL